ncbi:MAG: hypothetical protein ABIN01_13670 [Ferruginibacter sp.]
MIDLVQWWIGLYPVLNQYPKDAKKALNNINSIIKGKTARRIMATKK